MGMLRRGAALVAAVGVLTPLLASAGPKVTAKSAVIMDASAGAVLWERAGDTPRPPASTTKVMTAIVALESGRLDEGLRVSKVAAAQPASKIYLRQGQRMELDDLLYAILLNSANDAALVIAEGLGGSKQGFAAQMNAKARIIGATASNFKNPHGLTEKNHVSTATDLAKIFRYALSVPKFRRVIGTQSIRVPVYTKKMRRVSLRSHNRLLTGYRYKVIGKTGYTRAARRCFVGSARHEGREVVIAFLGSSDLWGDARRLFTYAFEHTGKTAKSKSKPARRHVSTNTAPRRRTAPTVRKSVAAKRAPSRSVTAAVRPAAEPMPAWVTAMRIERPGTVSAERFTVRFGPFADDHSVESMRRRLADAGYVPQIAGRALRLGSFASHGRAMHLAQRLRRKGHEPHVVALY